MDLILVIAVLSAAAVSHPGPNYRGRVENVENVELKMTVTGKPVSLQFLKATIGQLSSRVFQIVVDNEHEACQLAKIVNPNLGELSCSAEPPRNAVGTSTSATSTASSMRRLTACDFNAGFCEWSQESGDQFDWALTSESTPTANTGPNNGYGGGGSFIFIEANDQAEGDTASITSSTSSCGLDIAYHMKGGGIGSLVISKNSISASDGASWVPVWTKEGGQSEIWKTASIATASANFFQISATRGAGIRGDIAIDSLALVACTDFFDHAISAVATASSVDGDDDGQYRASNANDGDDNSRWGSDGQIDPQWIAFELLTSEQTITSVNIKWEAAYSNSYHIQHGSDGSTSDGTSDGCVDLLLPSGAQWDDGGSFGDCSSYAGSSNSGWACGTGHGSTCCEAHGHSFSNGGLNANQACCACGGGSGSGSDNTWTTVVTETGAASGVWTSTVLPVPISSRFWRIFCVSRATDWGYSMYTAKLLGPAPTAAPMALTAAPTDAPTANPTATVATPTLTTVGGSQWKDCTNTVVTSDNGFQKPAGTPNGYDNAGCQSSLQFVRRDCAQGIRWKYSSGMKGTIRVGLTESLPAAARATKLHGFDYSWSFGGGNLVRAFGGGNVHQSQISDYSPSDGDQLGVIVIGDTVQYEYKGNIVGTSTGGAPNQFPSFGGLPQLHGS
jgi:hypothetical protein